MNGAYVVHILLNCIALKRKYADNSAAAISIALSNANVINDIVG